LRDYRETKLTEVVSGFDFERRKFELLREYEGFVQLAPHAAR
jgi:hypothetical protein